jgi:hypothetical protein
MTTKANLTTHRLPTLTGQIAKALRDASHDQILELADFLTRHPFIPQDEFLTFIKKHWGGSKSDREPHHNKTKGQHA